MAARKTKRNYTWGEWLQIIWGCAILLGVLGLVIWGLVPMAPKEFWINATAIFIVVVGVIGVIFSLGAAVEAEQAGNKRKAAILRAAGSAILIVAFLSWLAR